MNWYVLCGDEGGVEAIGPFSSRDEAQAELDVIQSNRLTMCQDEHTVTPGPLPDHVVVRVPCTTEAERRQQMARTAASRNTG